MPDKSASSEDEDHGQPATPRAPPRRNNAESRTRSPPPGPPARPRSPRHPAQLLDELIASYASDDRGVEIREIAGGYRMATKPECHDAVRAFVKSLKPPLKLSLPALETLAVIAYKQPVTAPEVNEIRGVDSSAVFGSLLARKLITTAGRKPVIGRPILYKTTREFLLRFGLKDVSELPSMEEFEKMAAIELDEPELSAQAGSRPVRNKPESEPGTGRNRRGRPGRRFIEHYTGKPRNPPRPPGRRPATNPQPPQRPRLLRLSLQSRQKPRLPPMTKKIKKSNKAAGLQSGSTEPESKLRPMPAQKTQSKMSPAQGPKPRSNARSNRKRKPKSKPKTAPSPSPNWMKTNPSPNPKPRPPAKLERLQKILAQAGVASRRKAEEMIEQGRVQVNGKVVTVLGTKADAGRDHIRVDGKLLQGAERLRYFVLNKPRGFVTTVKDPEGRPTVMQFFDKMRERLYPVGRLDYMSEGLLVGHQ